MRDLEFLPMWYRQFLKHRRLMFLQTWLGVMLVGGLALWMFLVDRNQKRANGDLGALRSQIAQTTSQIREMDKYEVLHKQWGQQAEVLERMGLHIEAARLLARLEDALPANVALTNFELQTTATPLQLTGPAAASIKDPAHPPVEAATKLSEPAA